MFVTTGDSMSIEQRQTTPPPSEVEAILYHQRIHWYHSDERIELAKAMRSEGKTYQQIADELELFDGFKIVE